MRHRKGALLLTLTAIALAVLITVGYAIPRIPEDSGESLAPLSDPAIFSPKQVVETFLKAVDRGELTLFIYTLNRSILAPRRVEYVYDLDTLQPKVTVYSELKEAIPVPHQLDLVIRAVSAELDRDGHITETRAHVFTDTDVSAPLAE